MNYMEQNLRLCGSVVSNFSFSSFINPLTFHVNNKINAYCNNQHHFFFVMKHGTLLFPRED